MLLQDAPSSDLNSLALSMRGQLIAQDAPGWDLARQAWALSVDQRPAAVALPECASDVVAVVDYARRAGLRVAAQGTGHNAHTLEGELAHTILLRTSAMRDVEIRADERIARVEAGAVWSDVTGPAAEHGLAALAGSSPDVGVVGYTLGGGLSWLSRSYGLAANSVTAIEVVTAEGRLLRADEQHHADLFWALRGGGGSFAVVTAIEFRLYPVAEVYAGAMFWPQERAGEVLQAWREWTQQDLPEEIISVGRLVNVPPFPDVPEPLRGRSFVVVEVIFDGPADEGERLIAALRGLGPEIDTVQSMPAAGLQHLHMDPEGPTPAKGDGLLLREVTSETIEALVRAAGSGSGCPLISVELRQLGGAIGRSEPGHGALGAIDAPYAMFAVGPAPEPGLRALVEEWVSHVKHVLAPWKSAQSYMNFSERRIAGSRLFAPGGTYPRLREVKGRYDASDLIQGNHPIPPLG